MGTPHTWILLAETVGLGVAVAAVALLIGVPLGVLFGKTDILGRQAAMFAHGFPLFLPPFFVALGWFHLLGRGGLLGSEVSSGLLFSRVGLIAVLGLAFSPIATGLTVMSLWGIDSSLEEAGRSVAHPVRVIARILVPISRPTIALAALIVFALGISEIGVPMFLHVKTYAAAVFARLGGISYAPGEAFALVVPLLAVALVLIVAERRLVGRRSFASLGARSNERRIYRLGRWRVPVSVGVWLVSGLCVAPIVSLVLESGLSGFMEMGRWMGASLFNSLAVSFMGATVITAIGVVVGHRLARRRRGGDMLDELAMFAFIIPAAVLGVGLVAAWNRPATQPIYTSMAIMVIGLAARYLAIGVRTIAATVSRSSPSYEEAAAAFGGGFVRRLTGIVAPMHAKGIIAAWLLAMVFCLRDLETVVAFYPPGSETLPIRIFTLEANGPENVVAALALTHAAVTGVLLVLGRALLKRGWRS